MKVEESSKNAELMAQSLAMTDVIVDGWVEYWGMVKCTKDDYIE